MDFPETERHRDPADTVLSRLTSRRRSGARGQTSHMTEPAHGLGHMKYHAEVGKGKRNQQRQRTQKSASIGSDRRFTPRRERLTEEGREYQKQTPTYHFSGLLLEMARRLTVLGHGCNGHSNLVFYNANTLAAVTFSDLQTLNLERPSQLRQRGCSMHHHQTWSDVTRRSTSIIEGPRKHDAAGDAHQGLLHSDGSYGRLTEGCLLASAVGGTALGASSGRDTTMSRLKSQSQ